MRPGKRMRTGAKLSFGDGELTAEVVEELPGGNRLVRFDYEGIFLEVLERLGKMPLPPYIRRKLDASERDRYQTVYHKEGESAAAPTAGLHFTPELLERIKEKGVILTSVLLNVGLGTFRPVKSEDTDEHEMHEEYYEIGEEAAGIINKAKAEGRRVIGVGTTKRASAVRWGVTVRLLWAWIITIPVSALMAMFAYWVLGLFGLH